MKILLIDDDLNLGKVVGHQLQQHGFKVTTVLTGNDGIRKFKSNRYDIIISDIQLPDISGIDVLKEIRRADRNIIFIIITAFGSVTSAVNATKLDADDYLTKPFSKEQLLFTVGKAIELRKLREENKRLKLDLNEKFQFDSMVAQSHIMQNILKTAIQVADSDASVLIMGESGTGKELIAQAIHYNSQRKDHPLVTVNCPSIPENLLESELYGHKKGSFTGAVSDKKGKFEIADRGTVFLDEIGDLRIDLQAKLLRVLQEHTFERIGDSRAITVDIRIIAATNRNLTDLIRDQKFREDLYYRLSVVPIILPPLRDRPEDIPYLVDHFLQKYSRETICTIDKPAMQALQSYSWPGNVRELENIIHRLITLSVTGCITAEEIPDHIIRGTINTGGVTFDIPEDGISLDLIEEYVIKKVLAHTGGNQSKAATLLKIPRHVLIYRMKKYNIP